MGVPLAQLEGIRLDPEAAQAIADWHYWCSRGYRFKELKHCPVGKESSNEIRIAEIARSNPLWKIFFRILF
jgi:hypothetical protein